MSLQTVVKAGNITNLSDARYCAGMGVEIIGYPVGKSAASTLEPSKIKEIAGWLSGVKMALEPEINDFDETSLLDIIESLSPDYLQVPFDFVQNIKKITNVPFIIVADVFPEKLAEGDYLLYTGSLKENNEALIQYCEKYPVILAGNEIEASSVLEVLKTIKPYGIELKGGTEISPGLKSFEQLSEILELLEVEE